MSFGYKTAWFAARTTDATALAHALGLANLRPAPADVATAAAYEHDTGNAFITPVLEGWTLVMSKDFLDLAGGSPPSFVDLLCKASAELRTEVQFFASYRVCEVHGWARATQGELSRAYCYDGSSGDIVIDHGEPTAQEVALGHRFFNPAGAEAEGDTYWERTDLRHVSETDVMQLAGLWSIDPSERDDMPDGLLATIEWFQAAPPVPPRPSVDRKPWWQFW
ncbi:hypothetical protein ACS5PN_24865 [Roseateles sp. NT4]|uniref:hypothetical protein n=1 Tax=Roseateles sp. NT4 TaxID=3453715 RepID=UPI003EE93466